MVKKIDKFILQAFFGPFIISLPVVVFIFLVQTIMKYIDELVGKDIGFDNFAKILIYFGLSFIPMCLPLGIMMGSLISFGSLGEHNELTAIKSAGISLLRILRPVFFLVVLLTIFSFWFNNYVVPWANLKAFSLLYDIRHKKPSLDIKEGAFYNGLPGYSIKVAKKFKDGKSLKGILIYDHTHGRANCDLISADSGTMYSFHNNKWLAIELYNGNRYSEQIDPQSTTLFPRKYIKTSFKKAKICFSLASFEMQRTNEQLFKSHRMMRNIIELKHDIDSISHETDSTLKNMQHYLKTNFLYSTYTDDHQLSKNIATSLNPDSISLDSLYKKIDEADKTRTFSIALDKARTAKENIEREYKKIEMNRKEERIFQTALYLKFTQPLACIIFFLIGAPLGAIIKKGGLGVPMIISVFFFILYYVLTMMGEKWTREFVTPAYFGMTYANVILILIGLFFLKQAKNDSRILDKDLYYIFIQRVKNYLYKKHPKST
ncbi:MAG: LptF/LptG family permease [Cytophagaceae bacterium]|nr:LptF/LptG family permease [Cytophagaceae bacterium]MDW8456862.1 LptF/LptG family permease [Cytophagaceae bacterium]